MQQQGLNLENFVFETENIILSEISQTPKEGQILNDYTLHGISRIWTLTFIRDKKQNKGYQGPGERRMGSYCLMSTEFLFGTMKRMVTDSSNGYTTIGLYIMPLNCTLKKG